MCACVPQAHGGQCPAWGNYFSPPIIWVKLWLGDRHINLLSHLSGLSSKFLVETTLWILTTSIFSLMYLEHLYTVLLWVYFHYFITYFLHFSFFVHHLQNTLSIWTLLVLLSFLRQGLSVWLRLASHLQSSCLGFPRPWIKMCFAYYVCHLFKYL